MVQSFAYEQPDAEVPWEIQELGEGVVARYRRTIALRARPITGTGGYREGVDFHTEIHCPQCCCEATVDAGCGTPAGGFVVIGGRAGCPNVWPLLIQTMAAAHLQDAVRHVSPRRCTSDACPRTDGITTSGGNA